MRTTLVNISFAVVTSHAANAWAQPPPVAAPTKSAETNPSTNPTPAKQPRSSVSRVVEAIAADIAHVPGRMLVISAPLIADAPAPRGSELALLLANHVAGRRGAGARALDKTASLADARAEARAVDVFTLLKSEISGGKLRLVADVFPVPRTVWARVRDPEPGPIAHAFAEAPFDPEVRTYLAPVSLTQVNVVRGQNFEGDVQAVACADLDADGATEIISVSRRRVTTLRLRDGKVVPLRSRNWADLSPLAPIPLRESVGFAALVERPTTNGDAAVFLDVGLSDRSKSVRLDGHLAVMQTLSGWPVGSGEASACVRSAQPWISGAILPCLPNETALQLPLGGAYDAFASAALISQQGQAFVMLAARNDRGIVEVRDDAGHATTFDGAGAQLAVGDLDLDGEPEILSSLDVPFGTTDAVVIRTWTNRGFSEAPKPKEMMRLPVAAGVRALAVCPPESSGRAPFVVATADEIWVAR